MFHPNTEYGKELYSWWTELQEDNKGGRAELRRCREPVEALRVSAYHDLHRNLRQHGYTDKVKLLAIAALTAHVKQVRGDKRLAQQMAASKVEGGTTPQLSELRFRRLLQHENLDELFPALRRVVNLLNGHVNLYSLASSVYCWGDRERRQWAYDYYGELQPNSKRNA
ncbi:type I-E CRISPR-associated protein Cse2/CasB [Candidatus Entotheonella palauensis]|uniref:type I-E CRISPR-associated protein Cse2/CasB n=1 Tax=Candidatus Entotheonella palauensis TaxID=93172 RepID=UPI000B7C7D37|nr:type I-E CRISPR-associated protein Cse2/CasB [Candidatus Entotheonella palauensis]